jgi:glycosyltransferase involved in cell wall biosynthesis
VLTVHDLHIMTHPLFCSRSNRLHYSLLLPPSLRKAAAVIAFSSYTQRVILDRFPEVKDRIVIIPPGLSPTLARCTDTTRLQAVRQRYSLPASFLLFLGDITARKNILGLLSAFALVQKEHPDLHLVLAGAADAPTAETLDQTVRKHGILHRVTRTGYVEADDLPALYSLAQAFVFASHDEGFGLPPLEAMACGCPVVCSGGAVIENCGGAAITCDPCDLASIARAINVLLDNSDIRKKMIRAGHKLAAEYTWEKAARKTEAVYRAVINRQSVQASLVPALQTTL